MAVTVLAQPQQFAAIKNPMVLRLETDNHWETAPVKSRWGFRVNNLSGPINDDTITIGYNNNSFIFVFKTTVTGSDPINWIRIKGISESIVDYLEHVAERISNIITEYVIEYFYDPDDDVHGIKILAKEGSEKWNLTLTSSDVTKLSNWSLLLLNYTAGVQKTNYRLFCRLFVEEEPGSTIFKFVKEQDAHVDINGIAEFQVNRLFVFDNSYAPSNEVVSDYPCIYRYYLQWGEKYGEDIVWYATGSGSSSNYKIALNGGFSTEVFPQLIDIYTEQLSGEGHKLLNVLPRIMVINKHCPIWLYYFLASVDEDLLSVEITAYYEDEISPQLVSFSAGSAGAHTVTAIAVGPSQISENMEISLLTHYSVKITRNTDSQSSESFLFIISEVQHEFNRYFIYKNSLGTYDTLWCSGEAKSRTIHEFEEAKIMLPANYTASDREILNYNKTYSKDVDVPVGVNSRDLRFDPQQWAQCLSDLLNSDDVFEVIGDQLLPIVVLNKAVELPTDAQSIVNFDLKYKYAHTHSSFTPKWLYE